MIVIFSDHKKTKVLITHGGYNSMQEAINSGTALLTLPLFGDQYRNGRAVEKHHLGSVLNKEDVTVEGIIKHLKNLLENQRFEESVLKMQKMIQKQPISPEQKLVKWTEFLAEFKNLDNLKPVGADLGFITFYNIDVYVTVMLVIGLILGAIYLGLRFVFRKIVGLFLKQKPKTE
uniref:Glucuronosyltransferase n=1 Tax=Panagrolaimus sp. JU765 TaxID=591449 RepID=A0AC34RLR5_9BILA